MLTHLANVILALPGHAVSCRDVITLVGSGIFDGSVTVVDNVPVVSEHHTGTLCKDCYLEPPTPPFPFR